MVYIGATHPTGINREETVEDKEPKEEHELILVFGLYCCCHGEWG